MSVSDDQLGEIERRLAAATGSSWELGWASSGLPEVRVDFADGSQQVLRVTREADPAELADVAFIVCARRELPRLVAAVRGSAEVPADDLAIIERVVDEASAGPWKVFLEDDGGVGGTNMIWISDRDDEPDMYLWMGDDLAPSADFEFVAEARQDLPALIAAIREIRHE